MAAEAAKKLKAVGDQSSIDEKMLEKIQSRKTPELVLAFCGPLGSGTSTVATKISDFLEKVGYEVHHIKASSLIAKNYKLVEIAIKSDPIFKKYKLDKIENLNEPERIPLLQFIGNRLREKFEHDIIAQMVICEIAAQRIIEKKSDKKSEKTDDLKTKIKNDPRKFATIVDSLKNPAEIELLQAVYGDMFYLFGCLCPEPIRKMRLNKGKKIPKPKAEEMMERDKAEDDRHGQQLLKTLQYADFFITNIKDNLKNLDPKIKRYLSLILGDHDYTPSISEYAMYNAQSAALRSGCLSRQVGAAIVSEDGTLLATGCNDVPKFKGGLYTAEDGDQDNRCQNISGHNCKNHAYKEAINEEIKKILEKNLCSKCKKNKADKIVKEISKHDRLKGLIEFSRAVHAEMDAITSVARQGNVSLKNATLYCTTFPCHHCARHILAAGIVKVFYIEPYEKSLAYDLHEDAIVFETDASPAQQDKLIFAPFEGVAPRQYLRLFCSGERKQNGKKIEKDLSESMPSLAKFLDTHIDFEQKVIEHLQEKNIALLGNLTILDK